MSRMAVAGALVWALLAAGASPAATLAGPDFDTGVLYDIDTTTGLASNPRTLRWGSATVTGLVGVAPGTPRYLLALSGSQGSPWSAQLVRVHVANGRVDPIGATGLDWLIEADLALDPISGDLYGIQDVGPSALERRLFGIDVTTGEASVIGDVDPSAASVVPRDYSAMAFDAAGNLFVLDTAGARLLGVNKATAAVLTNVTLSGAVLGDLAGMTADPGVPGLFFVVDGGAGGTSTLYSLDSATGVLTAVGSGLGGPTSIAGLVPEPGAALLGWSALVSLGLLARRRAPRHQCARAMPFAAASAQAPPASRA